MNVKCNQDRYKQIDLKAIHHKSIKPIHKAYLNKYGTVSGPGFYSPVDWARIEYVYSVLPKGGNVLDVGVGAGQFLNLLSFHGDYKTVSGVDIRKHSKFLDLNSNFDLHTMNIAKLEFPDNHFDVVICMEVLEHVDRVTFNMGLHELRRVTKNHLLMSVPYCEGEPLPSYHKLRFEDKDLKGNFPNGDFTLLMPGTKRAPWTLIQEVDPA